MTREDYLRSHLDVSRPGLEIGPSHNPVAPRRLGYRVEILDHLDKAGLVAKYTGHPVDLSAIEDVDHVWRGEPWPTLVHGRRFSWVVASHVIEHAPDLIGFLENCSGVLEPDGKLVLAVPDKRRCFDHFRPESGLAAVIDAHLARRTHHTPGTAAEYFLRVCQRGGQIAWDTRCTAEPGLVHSLEEARSAMLRSANGEYLDLHAWCFTPASFELLIAELAVLGLTDLGIETLTPTDGSEFYATLRRGRILADPERIRLLSTLHATTQRSQSDSHNPDQRPNPGS